MNPIDDYADWDAAYVLGALPPAERREFESHLAECDTCAAGVAELAVLPGLLAKVPPSVAGTFDRPAAESPVPNTLLPRLVRSARRRRRRSRGIVAGAIVATAAAAAAVALAIPLVFPSPVSAPTAAGPTVSLSQVVPSSLSAKVRLVREAWGTRIEMTCRYADSGATGPTAYRAPRGYAMFVTDAQGHSLQVATWTAVPGSTVEPSGTTGLAPGEIAAVDVRSVTDGRVLLSGSP